MIRHRPTGSGHPYSDDTEQRSPAHPVEGEPLRLGVRTTGEVAAVVAELVVDDGEPRMLPLAPVARSSRGQAVDGGHLASAQARTVSLSSHRPVMLCRNRTRPSTPPSFVKFAARAASVIGVAAA